MKKTKIAAIISIIICIILSGCGNTADISTEQPKTAVSEETLAPIETEEVVEEKKELEEEVNPNNFTLNEINNLPEFSDEELAFSWENGFSNRSQYDGVWAKINAITVWDYDTNYKTIDSQGMITYSFADGDSFANAIDSQTFNAIGYITADDQSGFYSVSNVVFNGFYNDGTAYTAPETTDNGNVIDPTQIIVSLDNYDLSDYNTGLWLGSEYYGCTVRISNVRVTYLSDQIQYVYSEDIPGIHYDIASSDEYAKLSVGDVITITGIMDRGTGQSIIRNCTYTK